MLENTKKTLLSLLNSDNYGTYYRPLAQEIGLVAAALLGHLIYRFQHYEARGELKEDGSFYCTSEEIECQCGIKRYAADSAIKELKNLGLLEVILRGLPATRHFKLNIDKVLELATSLGVGKQVCRNLQTGMQEPANSPSYTRIHTEIKERNIKKDPPPDPASGEDPPDGAPNFSKAKKISEEAKRLSEKLWGWVRNIHPKAKPPKIEKWSEEIDKMLRIDKRTSQEVEAIIDWAFDKSDFWCKTLQSAEGLRKHYDKMYVQMSPPQNTGLAREKNMESARKVKGILIQNGEGHKLTIYKNSVIRQDTQESISMDLPPETFADILCNWFNLRRKE